jgi:transcriptional regulator with XRE-family HTH domain
LNQADLAARVGRAPARISELERDLLTSRLGKDRLTLLAEICDALDLVMVLRPRDQLTGPEFSERGSTPRASGDQPSVFDEVFVDLSADG